MKIALIGHGKMGKLIEEKALSKSHTIVAIVNSQSSFLSPSIRQGIANADVCIDFSHPDSVVDHIKILADMKKNIVMGTTGWTDRMEEAKEIVETAHIGMIYAPNFALGVSLFLALVEQAAALISPFDAYDVSGIEIHHNKKIDCPSGTAQILAETINKHRVSSSHPMAFSSVRVGDVPGTHSILFDSMADTITLTHTTRNREGFALGALHAAEWLCGKQGMFTMYDLLFDKRKDRV